MSRLVPKNLSVIRPSRDATAILAVFNALLSGASIFISVVALSRTCDAADVNRTRQATSAPTAESDRPVQPIGLIVEGGEISDGSSDRRLALRREDRPTGPGGIRTADIEAELIARESVRAGFDSLRRKSELSASATARVAAMDVEFGARAANGISDSASERSVHDRLGRYADEGRVPGAALGESQAFSIVCRSDVCRVVVDLPDSDAYRAFKRAWAVSRPFPVGYREELIYLDDGSLRAVFFSARSESDLPVAGDEP